MVYSVEGLQTVAECNALIVKANKRRIELVAKKASYESQIATNANDTLEVPLQLQNVLNAMADLQVTIAGLTDPEDLKRAQIELSLLDTQKLRLELRETLSEGQNLVEKQFGLAKATSELADTEEYHNALLGRKAVLEAATG